MNQFFEREVPNLPRGFVNKMASDAKQKMSESPSDLIAQGVANGLSAVAGAGRGEPPAASPGAVLANSAARQAASASLSVTADTPPNAIASSGGDDSGSGKRANSGASSGGSGDSTGQAGATMHLRMLAGSLAVLLHPTLRCESMRMLVAPMLIPLLVRWCRQTSGLLLTTSSLRIDQAATRF